MSATETDADLPANFGMTRPASHDRVDELHAYHDAAIARARGKMTEKAISIQQALVSERLVTALLREQVIVLLDTIAADADTIESQGRIMRMHGITPEVKPPHH